MKVVILILVIAVFGYIAYKSMKKKEIKKQEPKTDWFKAEALGFLQNMKTVGRGVSSYGDWMKYLIEVNDTIQKYMVVPEFAEGLSNLRKEVLARFE